MLHTIGRCDRAGPQPHKSGYAHRCLCQEKVERVGPGGDRAGPDARARHPPHPAPCPRPRNRKPAAQATALGCARAPPHLRPVRIRFVRSSDHATGRRSLVRAGSRRGRSRRPPPESAQRLLCRHPRWGPTPDRAGYALGTELQESPPPTPAARKRRGAAGNAGAGQGELRAARPPPSRRTARPGRPARRGRGAARCGDPPGAGGATRRR
jgi:hypothetical protein